jgi:hypothetical protein
MKKIALWISELLQDESGVLSSKRFIGMVAGLSLCATLFLNQMNGIFSHPSSEIVAAVAALSFGCLGLSSVDKFRKSRNSKD